jgi:3-methyladenine DNA glycosylase/8-oxoguanine DNA glycosylase
VNFRKYGERLEVEAWGEGSEWALEHSPDFIGMNDRPEGLVPQHDVVRDLARRSSARIGASRLLWEALFYAVIHQKVTGIGAGRSMRDLTFAVSEPAPGPSGLMLIPAAERIAAMGYWEFHRFGLERKRAEALREVARHPKKLRRLSFGDPAETDRILQAMPGIGIWSSAIARGEAMGDTDAVPVGDYHIKNTVAWALAGEERGTDERMLELLEPYIGQRLRVVRLLKGAGISAPKYGPHNAVRSIHHQ